MESSTFGSNFVALGTAHDIVRSMRYKLIIVGIPIDREANLFSDNEVVWKNASWPDATLTNKHMSVCFHAVQGEIDTWIMPVGFVKGRNNLAGYLLKMMSGMKMRSLCGWVFNWFGIYKASAESELNCT